MAAHALAAATHTPIGWWKGGAGVSEAILLAILAVGVFGGWLSWSYKKGFEAGYVAKKEYNHKALDATRREYYQHGFLEGQYALRPQLEKFDVLVEMVTVDTEHLERCLKATKEKMNQEQNKK